MNHWNQKRKRPNPQSVEEKQEFLRKKEDETWQEWATRIMEVPETSAQFNDAIDDIVAR